MKTRFLWFLAIGHEQNSAKTFDSYLGHTLPIALLDQATEGGIVKVRGTLPDKVVLVNFGALIPNMVVIPKGVAAFSLYFSFKPRFRRKS